MLFMLNKFNIPHQKFIQIDLKTIAELNEL